MCVIGICWKCVCTFECRSDNRFSLMMDCDQVTEYMLHLPSTKYYFRKCLTASQLLSYDIIPDRINIFIVLLNSDPIGHFVLIYFANSSIIIFDPAGTDLMHIDDNIKHFVMQRNLPILLNEKQLQGSNSCLCGVYCIFVSLYLSIGYSFKELMSWFSSDPSWNDISIYRWFIKRVAHSVKPFGRARMLQCKI